MNLCFGVSCMNLAKEVKWIKRFHYMCNNCESFGIGYEKTFASLANVQYYNVMFYTDFELM